jgi:hypothetical protein
MSFSATARLMPIVNALAEITVDNHRGGTAISGAQSSVEYGLSTAGAGPGGSLIAKGWRNRPF